MLMGMNRFRVIYFFGKRKKNIGKKTPWSL